MSLVADYSSSSTSDDDSEADVNTSEKNIPPSVQENKIPLPRPDFDANAHASKCSVFLNPYVEAENAKKAILEKHVKMVPSRDEVKFINGKQICWNYRKGRCRFGHNCKFAHDSDLHQSNAANSNAAPTITSQIVAESGMIDTRPNEVSESVDSLLTRKKRPGLSESLVPGKKVMNMYKKQKMKESWKN